MATTLEEGLMAFLSADANLQELIPDGLGGIKLYPEFAPQNTAYPYATYAVISENTDQDLAGTSTHQPRARVQIDAYCDEAGGYATAKAVARALKWSQGSNPNGPRLECFTGSLGGVTVQQCRLDPDSFRSAVETPESGSQFPVRRQGFDLVLTYVEQLT
jgi:Protein of unknown function (DUF3168)